MAKQSSTEPEIITDEHGIVWTHKYSVYSANIVGLIRAQVYYDDGGYIVQVGDLTLKNKAETAAGGMARAVRLVQTKLAFLFNKETS